MTESELRDGLLKIWRKDVGLREDKGQNRSEFCDAVCKHFGYSMGQPYCIGGLLYRAGQFLKEHNLKNPLPKTMSTQGFYNLAPERYRKAKGVKALHADICIQQTIKDPNRGHAYALIEDEKDIHKPTHTVEYNTNYSGSRDGGGVMELNIRSQDGDKSKKYRGAVNIVQWILDANK